MCTLARPSCREEPKWEFQLEHNGVLFPPEYEPHGIPILYDGEPVELSPEAEEVATMFEAMRESDYMNKHTFRKNFWEDWKAVLGPRHVIKARDGRAVVGLPAGRSDAASLPCDAGATARRSRQQRLVRDHDSHPGSPAHGCHPAPLTGARHALPRTSRSATSCPSTSTSRAGEKPRRPCPRRRRSRFSRRGSRPRRGSSSPSSTGGRSASGTSGEGRGRAGWVLQAAAGDPQGAHRLRARIARVAPSGHEVVRLSGPLTL